jgi:ribosomal protein L12E/L44/L45/RPP1/RPP2
MWEKTNFPKVACSLASLILLENDLKLSEENFEKIFNSSSVKVEAFWFSWFFTKLVKENSQFSKQNDIAIDTTCINQNDKKKKIEKEIEPIKEKDEESDEDMGFGLFD